MGETSLVDGLVEDSIELIKSLDSSGINPTLAVWYFYEDADDWRLLIAGPQIDSLLPKQETLAYQRISEAISSKTLRTLSIAFVKLIETKNPLPQALKFLIGTPADQITRAHFIDTTLNGIYIKEMLVLRSA